VQLEDFRSRVGQRIKTARWVAGWTQEEAASRVGLTFRHYAEMERGRTNPTLETLHRIAGAMNVRVADLVNVEPDRRWVALDRANPKPPPRGRKPRLRYPIRR
jgi:transcriptional regulator with XRE-family HTH domain